MGQSVYVEVVIGGNASAEVGIDLREMLESDLGSLETTKDGRLFAWGYRNYGNADEVEDFCRENDLAYVLTWASCSEFEAGGHAWRPGMEDVLEFEGGDSPSLSLAELRRDAAEGKTLADIIDALSVGDVSTLPPYVEEAGEEITDAGQAEELAPASPASVADVLARAEAFVAGFEDDDTQEGIPELLRDLRAAQGKEG